MEDIDYGYFLFKTNSGLLEVKLLRRGIFGHVELLHGVENKVLIEVSKSLSLREKVKTYVHELLHVAYHYNYFLDKDPLRRVLRLSPWSYPCSRQEEEEGMDKLSEEIYRTRPGLVKMLREEILSS